VLVPFATGTSEREPLKYPDLEAFTTNLLCGTCIPEKRNVPSPFVVAVWPADSTRTPETGAFDSSRTVPEMVVETVSPPFIPL